MKNLTSGNPCSKHLLRRGGGYDLRRKSNTDNTQTQLRGLVTRGFTMAEILLSLTIIGVVAAITLPSLTGNINERTWNTQRKALYARMSQAIALMPALNAYGTYKYDNTGGSVSVLEDNAAETFVTAGLAKVLKINNICDNEHLKECGIPSSFTNFVGSKKNWPTNLTEMNSLFTSKGDHWASNPQYYINTKAAAFETTNGESIAVYYNPYCTEDTEGTTWHYIHSKMCTNFIYDLNGRKGPNTVGKDIGVITALSPTNPRLIAPIPVGTKTSGYRGFNAAFQYCRNMGDDVRLPTKDELYSLFYNRYIIGNTTSNDAYWSITQVDAINTYILHFGWGVSSTSSAKTTTNGSHQVTCVKRP